MSSPDGLPEVFTYSEARELGFSDRRLYALRDDGGIESIGRGLFKRADAEMEADVDLLEIAVRAPRATLCLATALARHALTDLIPARIDVAVPRGRRRPRTQAPVQWHAFNPATFAIGRDELALTASLSIGLYGPERCIIDAYRLRRWEGPELGIAALRRWLARSGAQPAGLLRMAREFPQVERSLRESLKVLL